MLHALKIEGYEIGRTSLVRVQRKQRLWQRLSIFDHLIFPQRQRLGSNAGVGVEGLKYLFLRQHIPTMTPRILFNYALSPLPPVGDCTVMVISMT
jgi:hypothetical protein